MKKIKLLSCLIVLILVNACSYSDEFHTIQELGHFSIDLPDFAGELEGLSDKATYQYGNQFRNFYLLIEEEPLSKYPSVEEYAAVSLGDLLSAGTVSEPDTIEIKQINDLHGLSGRHLILTANVGEGELFKPILYHLLHLKSEERYYHLVLWTWAEWEKKYEMVIPQILDSFKGE